MSHAPRQKPVQRCPDCGGPLPPKKSFCAPACRQRFHNRMSKRGRVIMPAMLAWRAGRGGGAVAKAAFVELCSYLDACNAEDRAAGRPPMVEYVGLRESGWRERL